MRLDYLLQAHAFATTAERLPLKRAQQRIREAGLRVDGTLVRDPKHQVVPGVELITDASGAALEVDYAFCLLNKPAGHVSQRHPTEANVYDLIPPELARPDLAAFGRLDRDTTGMLHLFGTDPTLALALARHRHGRCATLRHRHLCSQPLLRMVRASPIHGPQACYYSFGTDAIPNPNPNPNPYPYPNPNPDPDPNQACSSSAPTAACRASYSHPHRACGRRTRPRY